MNLKTTPPALAIALIFTACSSGQYFEIEDPSTGERYYTNAFQRNNDGSVWFRDQVTGAAVEIENTEIVPLDRKEYQTRKAQAQAAARAQSNTGD
jgi:hypothetical protein